MLTWGLCIATYNRPRDLEICIEHALAQSRPPSEIVIVDGTPSFEQYRSRIEEIVREAGHGTPLRHVPEPMPSSARQRNRAIQLATSHICFLIDDDTILYPAAADRIMKLYEADRHAAVPAISGMLVHNVPPPAGSPEWREASAETQGHRKESSPNRIGGTLRNGLRALLKADDIDIPYDESWPEHPIPEALEGFPIGTRRTIAGHAMTVRREAALGQPFDEMLERYASHEDLDMSYRLSRQGPLLTALDAFMYHPPVAGRSLSPYLLATVQATNQIVLQRKNSTNLALSRSRLRRNLRRRVLIEAFKDLHYRNWSAPRARAFLAALRRLDRIFGMSLEELEQDYPGMQKEWFAAHDTNRGGKA